MARYSLLITGLFFQIDAHVGGVNDIAFAHPNKQLCIFTCGDDKTIKVWDVVAGGRQYTFEGHEAPVHSFILSTAIDGKIKAWLYDGLGSRVEYDAPGHWCTMMAYSEDGTRLFSCGTSKEGESHLVEWNESEGAIKRISGFRKCSLGASPRLRFNKEGSLLAVTTSDNGIKILANSDGLRLIRMLEIRAINRNRVPSEPINSKPLIVNALSPVGNVSGAIASTLERPDRVPPAVSINSLGPMDSSRLVDVKPRISDDGDKVKCWKIPDVSNPSQMKSLCLPDSIAPNKATAYVAPQLWQPPNGTLMTNDIHDGKPAEESAACIALSKNDSYVMSTSGGKVSLFNMMTFNVMTMFMAPPPAATYLAFHPQHKDIIAIGMEDSSIQIYNVRVDEVKAKLKGHQKRITGLAFSQTLNALVSLGADAQLCMWSIVIWEKLKSRFIIPQTGRQSPLVAETKVQFHKDQTHMLVVHDSQISIYDGRLECLRSCGNEIMVGKIKWSPKDTLPAPISSAVYSCDGLLVYAGFCDGAVGVFDADNLRLRCRIAASAYVPSFSVSSKNTTYPFVIAAHPSEPHQIALGMSDGEVHVVEPSDAELKWAGTPSQDIGFLPSNS
ncbi:hypothetical protein Patl1_24411 [Pistacia atlantica]|uniref:Uncharacterized protein n=1 Tax=Pistacia atlantica TaxID=434234 RepID=A0ACC0ZXD6_9ROSI|nr:hypothetical protein Patl1_24411 [Pistacia atlantica]